MKKQYGISGRSRGDAEIVILLNGEEFRRKQLTTDEYLNVSIADYWVLNAGDTIEVIITWQGQEVRKSYTVPANKMALIEWDIVPDEDPEDV